MGKIKGRPLRREVLVTLDKEVEKTSSGLILNVDSVSKGLSDDGFLKDDQTVVAIGNYCDDVKVGDSVKVNFDRYKSTKPTGQMEQTKEVVYNIPTLEFSGTTYGRIQETDIIWIHE